MKANKTFLIHPPSPPNISTKKMKTIVAALTLLAASTTATNAGSRSLRSQHRDEPEAAPAVNVKGSVDDAVSSDGCPCSEDQIDCDCGHVPTMVEHGHFADNEYQQKLHDLHNGEKHYVPTVVPRGYFGVGEEEQKVPKEMPEEKPNMVPPGHFAKVAQAIRDARLSKTFGSEKTQKEGACDILDHVLDLGRFIYEAEQTVEQGIADAGTAINGLLDVVCPLIEMRYPDAARCMPKCDAMKERVTKLSDPQFIGEIKTKKQKCEKTKGRDVNYALLAGLTGSDMLFGTSFCPNAHAQGPSCDKGIMEVEEAATGGDETGAGGDETGAAADPTADIKAAEKLVLQKEGLTWHRKNF